jgi:Tfp pilus assembly protein PilO
MPGLLDRLELRQLWLLGGGLLCLLAAGLATHGVAPQFKAYRAAAGARAALEATRASEPPVEQLLNARREEIAELGRRLHGERADMPARELEAVVVGRLQNVSWRHDVELTSVRPGRGEQLDVFEELLFDVELGGRYGDLYAWLEDLREEIAFVVIKSCSIRRAEDEAAGEPKLRATLTLASYRAL